MNTGTVQSQVKLQMLDMKWQKKKKDINQNKNENLSQEEILLRSLEDQAADVRKGRDTEQIYTKLKTGGTLTEEEIAYLKEHDPEALAEYEKAQNEKKSYEKALKNCKTKEDIDRLKMNRMGNFAARAKSIANSPYIPKDKKLELMNKLNNEVCCIRDAHMKFVKSIAYEKLPKEAEIAEARASETAAEKDELLAEQIEATEKISEDVESVCEDEIEIADNKSKELEDLHLKLVELEHRPESEKESPESEDLSFEKISRDIKYYLRKNGGKESILDASV